MTRVAVTPYERGILAFVLLLSLAASLLFFVGGMPADRRLAAVLLSFSAGANISVLVLRAERSKSDRR